MWHLKGTPFRSVTNFCSYKQFEIKPKSEDTIVPQDFQKEGLENKQLGIIKLRYPTVPT